MLAMQTHSNLCHLALSFFGKRFKEAKGLYDSGSWVYVTKELTTNSKKVSIFWFGKVFFFGGPNCPAFADYIRDSCLMDESE
jgi:hypothetical protein